MDVMEIDKGYSLQVVAAEPISMIIVAFKPHKNIFNFFRMIQVKEMIT